MTSPRPPEGTEPVTLHWLRYEHAATPLPIRYACVSWDTEIVEGAVVGFVEPQRNMGDIK